MQTLDSFPYTLNPLCFMTIYLIDLYIQHSWRMKVDIPFLNGLLFLQYIPLLHLFITSSVAVTWLVSRDACAERSSIRARAKYGSSAAGV